MRKLLAILSALLIAGPANANFDVTVGSGTHIFAIDGSNQGTSLCAAASTECPASVPVNTAGTPLFTASLPGQVGGAASAFADGWNITEGTKADAAWSGSGNGSIVAILKYLATQPTTVFAAISSSSVTRPANTTQYTANTAWCSATSACATTFSFAAACRANGTDILIPEIDIWSSANPATKLQGVLWLFNTAIGTVINDDATFTIASADFANLTGNAQGFPFTLANGQASGASNSGVSLTGTTYHAQCESGATTIVGMVQVVNTYTPASNEVLHVTLHTVGVN